MNESVVVEVLGTTNNVLERKKFSQPTIEIGRAFSNDLIINDEHADAIHARLEKTAEGQWSIVDLDSVNGIRRAKGRKTIDRSPVQSGDVFLLGRNKVRIFFGDHPVAPAVRIRWVESLLLWLGKPWVLIAMIAIYVGVRLTASYFSTIGEFKWSNFFSQNLIEALWFVALAVIVYFLSVLFRRGGNFMSHVSVLVAVFLLSALIDFTLRVALFNAGDARYGLISHLDAIAGYLIIFLYLWSVLYLAFHFSLKRRTIISLAVLGFIFIFNVLQDQMLSGWFDDEGFPLEQALLPPAFLISEPLTQAAFEDQTVDLFTRVEELRVEAIEEREQAEAERLGDAQLGIDSEG